MHQRWRALLAFIQEVLNRFTQERVPLSAGAIAFFTLLSLVPLILLAISVGSYFYFSTPDQASAFIREVSFSLGPELARVLGDQILAVVAHRGALTGFALLLGFWSGSQVFFILESALNLTWHTTRRRPYWMRRGLALLMVLGVGFLLGFAVALSNLVRIFSGIAELPFLHDTSYLIWFIISFVIPTLLVASIFALTYRVLPTRPVTLRTLLPGALFAAILWEITLHIFGAYITYSAKRFTLLYGSLGGLVLLMVWFYYSAQILMLGAEISAVYHEHLARDGDARERQADVDARD